MFALLIFLLSKRAPWAANAVRGGKRLVQHTHNTRELTGPPAPTAAAPDGHNELHSLNYNVHTRCVDVRRRS